MKLDQGIYSETLYPPLSLLNQAPVPFTWLSFIKNIMSVGESLLRGIMPLTVFGRLPNGTVHYLAHALIFNSVDATGNITLNIDRFVLFPDNLEERKRMFQLMLAECQRYAHLIHASTIKIELYVKSNGPICFPSGSSYLDSCNSTDLPHLFLSEGFEKDKAKYCLGYNFKEQGLSPSQGIRPIGNNRDEVLRYFTLCHEGEIFIKHTRELAFGPSSLAARNLAFLSNPHLTLLAESGLFRKTLKGIVHWSPNIYPYLSRMGSKTFYQDLATIMKHGQFIKTGKIFNLIGATHDLNEIRNLCLGAMEQIRSFGLSACQIGEVSEDQDDLLHMLREENFVEIHIIRRFVRHL